MPTDVVKPKVTTTQVLENMARLTVRQLETVIEQAAIVRVQKRKGVLSERESDLLRVINRGLGEAKSARLEQLEQKLREDKLTRREHHQLLRFTDELERLAAQHLKALIELAALRKTSVARLMHEMGLADAAYG